MSLDSLLQTVLTRIGTEVKAVRTEFVAKSLVDAKGDTIVGSADNTVVRKAVGSDGQVFTADSTAAGGVKWATPSAGGGSALDPTTLHATYGDDFGGSSLDTSKWTRVTYVSGDETVSDSRLRVAARAAGAYYYQAAPSGDWSLVAKFSLFNKASASMVGIISVDNSGNGLGAGLYYNGGGADGGIIGNLTAAAWASWAAQGSNGAPFQSNTAFDGSFVWMRLRRSGSNYYASFSKNGKRWSPESAAASDSRTMTRIGFAQFFSSGTNYFDIDFFDVQ